MFLFSLYTCVCIHVYKNACFLHTLGPGADWKYMGGCFSHKRVLAGGQQGARKLFVLCVGSALLQITLLQ